MAEMKISELSVGDWVKVDGAATKVWYLSQDGEVNDTTYDWVKPIPLTPEILEKNGLCVVEDADFIEYELFGSENFSIFHIKGTLHYRLETPQASVVCWNVHQLQHALRLAGVEKDIEL